MIFENHKAQRWTLWIIIAMLIGAKFAFNYHVRIKYDYYTPGIALLLVLWIVISILFRLSVDKFFNESIEDDNEDKFLVRKVVFRNSVEQGILYSKLFNLAIIVFLAAHSYAIFGRAGIIFSLSLIILTCIFSIFSLYFYRDKKNNRSGEFGQLILYGIVLLAFLWSGKKVYCSEFGVETIGHYFEKDTYESQYYVVIREEESDNEYKLPADIIVSRDFSEFESYETETGIGVTSHETTEIDETRRIKLLKVYFSNGGSLYFTDCLVPLDNSYDCTCSDQDDEDWRIEMTEEKVK
jgi:hypothetical protein